MLAIFVEPQPKVLPVAAVAVVVVFISEDLGIKTCSLQPGRFAASDFRWL